jgi:rubrerythrin
MFEADRNQDREKSLKSSADLSFEYFEEYATEALGQVRIIDDKLDEFEYYCDECGAIINEDDKFCPKCGVDFDDEEN